MAVTGFGFFSGGTTSLALSLVLLYGTGAALIVVICAVYRLVNRSAVKRTESAPADTAAGAFVDTTRSATEELLAALRPQAATGRPQNAAASPRTVRPAAAAAESEAKGVAAVASAVTVPKQSGKQSVKAQAKQPGKQSVKVQGKVQGKQQAKQSVKPPLAAAAKQGAPKPPAKTAPPKGTVKSAPKPSAKSALNKSVPNKSVPKKAAQSKAAKASQAKGRPSNSNGSTSTPAKRTGGSADRMPAKKQSSTTKDPGPVAGPAVSVQQPACSSPAKSARPVLVLASSNAGPQPSRLHLPDSRKRAS